MRLIDGKSALITYLISLARSTELPKLTDNATDQRLAMDHVSSDKCSASNQDLFGVKNEVELGRRYISAIHGMDLFIIVSTAVEYMSLAGGQLKAGYHRYA